MPAGRGRIRLTIATIALVALQSAVASAVQGQVVRGRLVDEGDNAAIAGAMITLMDRDGRGVERMLTRSGTGVFELRVPAPGEYRLRAERIGYGTTRGGAGRRQSLERGAQGTRGGGVDAGARPLPVRDAGYQAVSRRRRTQGGGRGSNLWAGPRVRTVRRPRSRLPRARRIREVLGRGVGVLGSRRRRSPLRWMRLPAAP